MAYGTLKDYAERLGLYPSYKNPRYLGKDIEFAYFEFMIPQLWPGILKDPDNAEYQDRTGVLPDLWWLDMITLPVHQPVKKTHENETFMFFKCRVPLSLMRSPLGLGYFAPNIQFNNDMAPPTPDHEKAHQAIFDRMKKEPPTDTGGPWSLTFRCNALDEDGEKCGREVTEIHDSPTEGLIQRYCGKCGSTRLQLVALKQLKKDI